MHLRNGNDPASNGNTMCVAQRSELTCEEGVSLLSQVANDCTRGLRALQPIAKPG